MARFLNVASAPGSTRDDITSEYSGEVGDRRYRFDRPDKHTFVLIHVTEKVEERRFETDESYSPAEGIPPALQNEIYRYADEKCGGDVSRETITIEIDLRHH